MNIDQALYKLREQLNAPHTSFHFDEQCNKRSFNIEGIKDVIKQNEILGILKQNEDLFKVWFYYLEHKDLNIIINTGDDRIKLVTIYPCESCRRKR